MIFICAAGAPYFHSSLFTLTYAVARLFLTLYSICPFLSKEKGEIGASRHLENASVKNAQKRKKISWKLLGSFPLTFFLKIIKIIVICSSDKYTSMARKKNERMLL